MPCYAIHAHRSAAAARTLTTMDTSPTALFDSYEQDFNQIIQSVRGRVDGDAQGEQAGEPGSQHSLAW